MLHFVPAILLLLLQGQAGVDRLSSHNGLPATLLALTSELEAVRRSDPETDSMASLIALSRQNPSLSAVLISILKSIESAPCDLACGLSDMSDFSDESEKTVHQSEPVKVALECFTSVSRFRDGPALL